MSGPAEAGGDVATVLTSRTARTGAVRMRAVLRLEAEVDLQPFVGREGPGGRSPARAAGLRSRGATQSPMPKRTLVCRPLTCLCGRLCRMQIGESGEERCSQELVVRDILRQLAQSPLSICDFSIEGILNPALLGFAREVFVRVIPQRDGGSCKDVIDACAEAGLLDPGRLQHILDHAKNGFSPGAIHFDVTLRRPGPEGVVGPWAWE